MKSKKDERKKVLRRYMWHKFWNKSDKEISKLLDRKQTTLDEYEKEYIAIKSKFKDYLFYGYMIFTMIIFMIVFLTAIIEIHISPKLNEIFNFIGLTDFFQIFLLITLIYILLILSSISFKKLNSNLLSWMNKYVLFSFYLFFICLAYIITISSNLIPSSIIYQEDITVQIDENYFISIGKFKCQSQDFYSLVQEDIITCKIDNVNLEGLEETYNKTFTSKSVEIYTNPIINGEVQNKNNFHLLREATNLERDNYVIELSNINYLQIQVLVYFQNASIIASLEDKVIIKNFEVGFGEKSQVFNTVYSLISITTFLTLFLIFSAINNLREMIQRGEKK
jgi:hypothetical protein